MNLIFSTGMARSGTNVITKALSVNKNVMMACGANIEIFRFFRNFLVEKYGDDDLKKNLNPIAPLDDYFAENHKIRLLKLILDSNFNEIFPQEQWLNFLNTSCSRVDHDASDLLPYFKDLRAETFKDIVENLAKVIKTARSCEGRSYIGMHESWNVEFFPSLARTFLNAKFIIIIRDPRSSISSMLRQSQDRPEIKAQIISYCRHFRKYVLLSNLFLKMKLFDGRLKIIKSEEFMGNPDLICNELCDFLEIDYDQKMVEPSNYYDYATGAQWTGNSAYEKVISNISYSRAFRWKEALSKDKIRAIEFLCGNEMKILGYDLETNPETCNLAEIFNTILSNDYKSFVKWRTDIGDPLFDFSFELFRHQVLSKNIKLDELTEQRLNLVART